MISNLKVSTYEMSEKIVVFSQIPVNAYGREKEWYL
jgi:hypothetical protein